MRKEGKKHSKLAIASFVISLFILLNFIISSIILFSGLFTLENNKGVFENQVFIMLVRFLTVLFTNSLIFPISMISIFLGMITLIRIKKKKNLKGKFLAIFGIVIPLIVLLAYFSFVIIIGGL